MDIGVLGLAPAAPDPWKRDAAGSINAKAFNSLSLSRVDGWIWGIEIAMSNDIIPRQRHQRIDRLRCWSCLVSIHLFA